VRAPSIAGAVVAVLAVSAAGLLLLPQQARAQSTGHAQTPPVVGDTEGPPLACEVRTILGERRPGGIDPRLRLFPQLTNAPFSAFSTLKLLRTDRLTAAPASAATLPLINGRRLNLTYEERLRAAGGPYRYRLHVMIERPGSDRTVSNTRPPPILGGETVFHAGQRYKTGILILAITCRAK
jgi:hypothetical protein